MEGLETKIDLSGRTHGWYPENPGRYTLRQFSLLTTRAIVPYGQFFPYHYLSRV